MHPIFQMIPTPRDYDSMFWIKYDQSQVCIRRGAERYRQFLEDRDRTSYYKWRYNMVLFDMMMRFDIDYDY